MATSDRRTPPQGAGAGPGVGHLTRSAASGYVQNATDDQARIAAPQNHRKHLITDSDPRPQFESCRAPSMPHIYSEDLIAVSFAELIVLWVRCSQ